MGQESYDVLIIGGGVIGSSIAYHLLNDGFEGTVAILEKDPSYEFASTPLSEGGVRQQFIQEVNIRMGLFGIGKLERFDEEMAVDGEPARVELRQRGYLFLGTDANWETLRKEVQVQRSSGVDVELMKPEEVKRLIPDLSLEGLRGASFGRRAETDDSLYPLFGPSAIPDEMHREIPTVMEEELIEEIIEAYGKAAAQARAGGLDGVEIHGGHSSLIAQFMSSWSNHRTDRDGGSRQRRLEFPLRVIQAVRKAVELGQPVGKGSLALEMFGLLPLNDFLQADIQI
jgi:glycine/D-amino acid oxidase-like deaminating enzyme